MRAVDTFAVDGRFVTVAATDARFVSSVTLYALRDSRVFYFPVRAPSRFHRTEVCAYRRLGAHTRFHHFLYATFGRTVWRNTSNDGNVERRGCRFRWDGDLSGSVIVLNSNAIVVSGKKTILSDDAGSSLWSTNAINTRLSVYLCVSSADTQISSAFRIEHRRLDGISYCDARPPSTPRAREKVSKCSRRRKTHTQKKQYHRKTNTKINNNNTYVPRGRAWPSLIEWWRLRSCCNFFPVGEYDKRKRFEMILFRGA